MKRVSIGLLFLVWLSLSSLQAQPLVFEKPSFPEDGNIGLQLRDSRETASFLDLRKLQMRHSFSMSVGSSAFGSQSIMAYQNQFMFPVNAKLSFYGNLILMQQAYASNPVMERLGEGMNSIYYDANMEYKFSDKTRLVLGISNLPTYSYPWTANPYTSNRMFDLWP
ncbi:MAG: hypothetical protein PWP06_788 [Candidatus Marinimicrobia bacterium]|jgi:hypothetical protein|nr:hypothetical protein [Candidatus Neomarinimicrobiota bacterium]